MQLNIGWPQVGLFSCYMIALGCSLATHGQDKKGKENFWTTLIATAIIGYFTWAGGFWTK